MRNFRRVIIALVLVIATSCAPMRKESQLKAETPIEEVNAKEPFDFVKFRQNLENLASKTFLFGVTVLGFQVAKVAEFNQTKVLEQFEHSSPIDLTTLLDKREMSDEDMSSVIASLIDEKISKSKTKDPWLGMTLARVLNEYTVFTRGDQSAYQDIELETPDTFSKPVSEGIEFSFTLGKEDDLAPLVKKIEIIYDDLINSQDVDLFASEKPRLVLDGWARDFVNAQSSRFRVFTNPVDRSYILTLRSDSSGDEKGGWGFSKGTFPPEALKGVEGAEASLFVELTEEQLKDFIESPEKEKLYYMPSFYMFAKDIRYNQKAEDNYIFAEEIKNAEKKIAFARGAQNLAIFIAAYIATHSKSKPKKS